MAVNNVRHCFLCNNYHKNKVGDLYKTQSKSFLGSGGSNVLNICSSIRGGLLEFIFLISP